jgi:hypothetical protein
MNDLHYAVVVGINRYPGFTDLSYAKTDAICFYEWLTNPQEGAIPRNQVELIRATKREEQGFLSIRNARPLRSNVEHALLDFHGDVLRKVREHPGAWEDTRLYLYVAGHGVVPSGGQGAVLFADCQPTNYYWGAHIDLLEYRLFYEKSGIFKEVVLLADCCREILAGTPPVVPATFGDYNLARGAERRFVGYATQMHQLAGEPEPVVADSAGKDGRGFFTRALLEGLRGKAVDHVTGNVFSSGLQAYVPQRVRELASEFDYHQSADLEVAGGELILCTVEVDAYPIEIEFPPGWTLPADLYAGKTLYAEWPGGSGPWSIELPSALYQVRAEGGPLFAGDGLFEVKGKGRRVVL